MHQIQGGRRKLLRLQIDAVPLFGCESPVARPAALLLDGRGRGMGFFSQSVYSSRHERIKSHDPGRCGVAPDAR